MKKLIVGNWKLYVRNLSDGKKLLKRIDVSFPRGVKSDIVVCPSVALAVALRSAYKGRRLLFGTQDVSIEVEGAHTGDISPVNLSESGIEYVLVGHAERRGAGDTDEIVSKKVAAALKAKLHPIICLGESERDDEGGHFAKLKKNVADSLSRVEASDASRLTLAYDPLWAIGQSAAPDPRVVREAILFIRKTLAGMWGRERALKTRIIYGGSVDRESAKAMRTEGKAEGLLIGRASVDAKEFAAIIKSFS